jgi:Flp pilus assembly protein TadG
MRKKNLLLRHRRRGTVIIYFLVCFSLFIMMCSYGVDLGRIYLAKSQLQTVADASARYGVKGMQTSASPMATALANASAVASQSLVDGAAPTITSVDVVRGTYVSATKTFTVDSAGSSLQVTVHQSFNRTGAVPLFASFLGIGQKQISATAIASMSSTSSQIQPPAAGNLWLSGMPDNTQFQNARPDNPTVWDNSGTSSNPKQRPLQITLASMGLGPGASLSFEGVTGTASYNNQQLDTTTNAADGDPNYVVANGAAPAASLPSTSANGISNVRAPIGAVMGVFMSDADPTTSAAPPNLDFGTDTSRDYTSISPQLKQVFFIGDGKRDNGEAQSIVVPAGATRVFFGMMDAWQWNDNVGNFQTNLYTTTTIQLVK